MTTKQLIKRNVTKYHMLARYLDNYDHVYMRLPLPDGTVNAEIDIPPFVAYQMRAQAEINGMTLVAYVNRSKSRLERYMEVTIESDAHNEDCCNDGCHCTCDPSPAPKAQEPRQPY